MIREIDDINVINNFLNKFGQNISSLDDPFKKYIGFEINGKIVSFLNYSLIYERMEIEYIYTLEEYRNNNCATKLLEYLFEVGKKNKCLNITLEVRNSNVMAISFYEKNGFKKMSIRKNYYEAEDGILMLRELV